MNIRHLNFNWKLILGELVIITLGVLMALAFEQWIHSLEEEKLELIYVSRLKADLNADIVRFQDFEDNALNSKRMILEAFEKHDPSLQVLNDSIFTPENLSYSMYEAIPEAKSVTYKEMESSGNLRLIRSQDIRIALSSYYDHHQLMADILADPIGDYKKILASSISGTAFLDYLVNEKELSYKDIQRGLNIFVSHPDYKAAVNAELYYTASLIYWLRDLQRECKKAIAALELEYANI